MDVIRASAMGMCFGVLDALEVARTSDAPEETTVFGELVHNEAVLSELEARGFEALDEIEREGALDRVRTKRVLVTAHGIADRERARLVRRGHELIDTTCPLVRRAHAAALALQREGRHVIVLGRKGHVEVRGLVGDLESFTIVQTEDDVKDFGSAALGIVCQTTLLEERMRTLIAAIELANPRADIVVRDTICEPTKERQRALRDLISRVEAIVVVGGAHSNNTQQLVATCRAAGRVAQRVANADELDFEMLSNYETVGLTAGTSTPDSTIDAVEAALRSSRVRC
ncbi:MAG: 4-hydroxy-3-methylbut-2-enyl diphosphate reductase [Planctomycetes bacterium]|nr:4-hydroxy-3-methylbut-2-enyl diphosphate reductase [Planctomycetota bacterium]MCB9891975.1 4-hydroxy-3-methylbut-2-enyl diphosphate reductase [Planctomycetota bacterium]MCB9919192.1 4-hydroxy-3-methylbut-2-enyl diphosphate reductase [Planctomycetota bacterium]